MNPSQPLTIEIVSDVVCPWCFIGLRRLDLALKAVRRRHPDIHCIKRWRPFFLNPSVSPEGEPYLPHLVKKFGGPERVQAALQHVRDAGAAYGLDYRFEASLGPTCGTMKRFYPWFFHDDTPRWKRAAARFLLVVTVLVLLAAAGWLVGMTDRCVVWPRAPHFPRGRRAQRQRGTRPE